MICRVLWPRRGWETPGKVSFELQLEGQTERWEGQFKPRGGRCEAGSGGAAVRQTEACGLARATGRPREGL